jgi:predicted 3-demethylubiquinone-9 3-methyltransferase (glyoxalase superfamily)
MQKITTFLWFDANAEDAIAHYMAIFPNSKIVSSSRYGDAGPGPKGGLMVATFELDGQEFMALNGGPHFKFTEAISLLVTCETQEEVDRYWDRLGEGGKPSQCGWLKDKFGLSWQIVPSIVGRMMSDPDAGKSKRAMQAMMRMGKIEISVLQKAFDGPSSI